MKKHVTNLIVLALAVIMCIGSIPVYGGEYEENIPAPNPIEAASDDIENADSYAAISDTETALSEDADTPVAHSVDEAAVQNPEAPTEQDADVPTVQDAPTENEDVLSVPEESAENPEPLDVFSNESQETGDIDQRIELGS